MVQKKVGVLIKEARTAAKLSQEKLAGLAGENLTAALISKCERGEADLTNAQLKKIAVACGVTQSSLLNAPKNMAEKSSVAGASSAKAPEKKTSAAKTAAAKTAPKSTGKKTSAAKPAAAKSAGQKNSSAKPATAKTTEKKPSAAKSSASAGSAAVSLTAAEKKLLEAYREATADQKKIALKVLKGEYGETVTSLLNATSSSSGLTEGLSNVVGDLLSGLLGGK